MEKHTFTVSEFREAWEEMLASHCDENGDPTTLCDRYAIDRLKEIDNDELDRAELHSDLEMDSIDLMEITGFLLERFGVFVDDAEFLADNSFDQTVQEYIGSLNKHQVYA